MSEKTIKQILIQSYKEASEQLKKGNPSGFRIIDGALDSMAILVDDKEIILQQAILGTVKPTFIEDQTDYEDGEKFLKKLGDIVENIGKAFELNDMENLNKLYREFIFSISQRWRQYRYLFRAKHSVEE